MRELEPVKRMEGTRFPSPIPKQEGTSNSNTISSDEWTSELAITRGTRCLRHFYPTNTRELVLQALEAAALHLAGLKRKVRKAIALPDQAIEAAAKVIFSSENIAKWEDSDDRLRNIFKEDARTLLEAVALQLRNSES